MLMSLTRNWLTARLAHVYWRFSRGLTLGVRVAAFDAAGRVALVHHSYVEGWHLPGGGIEVGQNALDAVEVELREEANVVLAETPDLFGLYHNARTSRRDHVALYVARNVIQPSPFVATREILAAGFFDPAAPPEGTTRATRERLAEIAGERARAAIW